MTDGSWDIDPEEFGVLHFVGEDVRIDTVAPSDKKETKEQVPEQPVDAQDDDDDDVRSPTSTPTQTTEDRDKIESEEYSTVVLSAQTVNNTSGIRPGNNPKDTTTLSSERDRSKSPFGHVIANFQTGLRMMQQQLDPNVQELEGCATEAKSIVGNISTKPVDGDGINSIEENKRNQTDKTIPLNDSESFGDPTIEDEALAVVTEPASPSPTIPTVMGAVVVDNNNGSADYPKNSCKEKTDEKSLKEKDTPSPSRRFQYFVDTVLSKTKANGVVRAEEKGNENAPSKVVASPVMGAPAVGTIKNVSSLTIPSLEITQQEKESSKDGTQTTNSTKQPLLGSFLSKAAEGLLSSANRRDSFSPSQDPDDEKTEEATMLEPESPSSKQEKIPQTGDNYVSRSSNKDNLLGSLLSQAAKGLLSSTKSSISNESFYCSEDQEEEEDRDKTPAAVEPETEAPDLIGGLLGLVSNSASVPLSSTEEHDQELAHILEEHTYSKPTNCSICSGLLVGLWSQGLQCRLCGMNVHRGEGVGGHDDCRAEALLMGCPGKHGCKNQCHPTVSKKEPVRVREVIEQFRQMAKEKPNLFQEVKAQMDRDFNSQVKGIIVSNVKEEQKSRSLMRARNNIVPFIQKVDIVETRGLAYVYALLFLGHLALGSLVGIIGWVGFVAALWPKYGLLTFPALRLAHIHNTTVLYSFHVSLLIIVLLFRRLINFMNRKSNVMNQFLREVLKLEAEQDLGVSVNGATKRAQLWIGRATLSSSIICMLALVLWQLSQPHASTFKPHATM